MPQTKRERVARALCYAETCQTGMSRRICRSPKTCRNWRGREHLADAAIAAFDAWDSERGEHLKPADEGPST